jgi:N-acetylglucosaminyldiphosphoundecaprenol N-acetyl-beta-D-mannosaminyltransferase
MGRAPVDLQTPRPEAGLWRRCELTVSFREAHGLPLQDADKAIWNVLMRLRLRNEGAAPNPAAYIGDLPIDAVGLEETALAFIEYCRSAERRAAPRPLFSTSVNGQVVSLCAMDRGVAELFRSADSINADGQPIVALSRLLSRTPLPERVATTDLFPVVARLAAKSDVTFYLLGGTEAVNRAATENAHTAYPGLRIVGRRSGYFSPAEEPAIVEEIARLTPDILWLGLGVPFEQQFCARNLDKLRGVGVVKTSGGLFDFLALAKPRAPLWMQRLGFEWLFRMLAEPRRLALRYLLTNPHALFVLARDLK